VISGELVEIVDLDERVVEIVSRAEMRRRNLAHRATYVMVFDSHGALLAHQRASWKDIWPSRWDLAFGGVCAVGEAWADAASRELVEEAGVVAPLRELSNVVFESDETRVVGRLYETTHDGPFEFAVPCSPRICWAVSARRQLAAVAASVQPAAVAKLVARVNPTDSGGSVAVGEL